MWTPFTWNGWNWCSRALMNEKIPVTMRYEKGHDINAACGQLRLRRTVQKPDA